MKSIVVAIFFSIGSLLGGASYIRHTVRSGETLWRISKKYGVTVTALKKDNPGLSPRSIRPGKRLRIPAGRRPSKRNSTRPRKKSITPTTRYRVRKGDTLWGISRRTGIPATKIMSLNGLTSRTLRIGQVLRFSGGGQRRSSVRIRSGTRKESGRWVWYRIRRGDSWWSLAKRQGTTVKRLKKANRGRRMVRGRRIRVLGRRNNRSRRVITARRSQRRRKTRRKGYFGRIPGAYRIKMSWPLKGRLVERFGLGRKWISNGITIKKRQGLPVRAAAAGVVAFYGKKRGYGLMVVIRHRNNIYSVYTNLGRVKVRSGQRVARRAHIGITGVLHKYRGHGVHFELYYKTKPVNPIRYLS